jgi:15-cis-phytoene synthase
VARKTSFYYSFLVLPAIERRAIIALFDFCRAVDDAVDLEGDAARARCSLERWREEVDLIFGSDVPKTAEGRNLQPFARQFHLPRQEFLALIDGVGMDIVPGRFPTFEDLQPYCHRVASSVGLICAAIFGAPDADTYARDLGVALQLTNILRDVAADYRRGRCYVPIEDLERFGCTEADLAEQVRVQGAAMPDRVRLLLEHQAARARVFFERAVRALPPRRHRELVAAEIMRAIYRDLLRRIEKAGCNVFAATVRVPRPVQASLAIQTWWRSRRAT